MLFHSRDIRHFDLPAQRIAHQPWVYYTTESWHNEVSWNSPVIKNESLFAMMDLSGTYALSSDIPQTYETKADLVSVLRAPLANFTEKRSLARGQSPILWIATYVISLL